MTHPCGIPATPCVPRAVRESSVPAAPGGRGALFALLGAALAAGLAPAVHAADRFPVTPEQRQTAEKAATGVALADLAPNAPSSYTIKRGDTLWSIATLFLKSPWRWPELWGMNQTQIHNPHLIYPGQTLHLVRTADGRAQLVMDGTAPAAAAPAPAPEPAPAPAAPPAPPPVPTVKLSPVARDLGASDKAPVPSIPNNQIEPFLSQPAIVPADGLDGYARIVATPQDRVFLGAGDTAYARGITDEHVDTYHVFRTAAPVYDPDDTARRSPIAYEAMYLGVARVTRRGEVTTLTITESKQEIGVGDRLVPIGHQDLITYVPRPPRKDIEGRIVSVYGGVQSAGAGSIVTLNRGSDEGLELGTVVGVLRNGGTVVDRTAGHERVQLPDETVGHAFVFRLADHLSHALLVSASGPIQVGDRIGPPESQPNATIKNP